jgi:putative hydrolase of the HAD superfamily
VTAVIRAVFFDFGGVVLTSPFDAFASYEQRSGLPAGFLRSVNATDPDANAWARLERSEIGVAEFVEAFEREAALLGQRVDGHAVLACLDGALRPAMVDAVRRCAERFTTALLTNNFLTGDGASAGRWADVLALFDVVVESSRVGVRKPDPRFYEIACELAGVEPIEVVFLDDLGVNLKPARAMGMTTIKVDDPAVAIAALAEVTGLNFADLSSPCPHSARPACGRRAGTGGKGEGGLVELRPLARLERGEGLGQQLALLLRVDGRLAGRR